MIYTVWIVSSHDPRSFETHTRAAIHITMSDHSVMGQLIQDKNNRAFIETAELSPLTFKKLWPYLQRFEIFDSKKLKMKFSNEEEKILWIEKERYQLIKDWREEQNQLLIGFTYLSLENRKDIVGGIRNKLNNKFPCIEMISAFIDLEMLKDLEIDLYYLPPQFLTELIKLGYIDTILKNIERLPFPSLIVMMDGSFEGYKGRILSNLKIDKIQQLMNECTVIRKINQYHKYLDLGQYIALDIKMFSKIMAPREALFEICNIFMGLTDDVVIKFLHEFAQGRLFGDPKYSQKINNRMHELCQDAKSKNRLMQFSDICLDKASPICLAIQSQNIDAIYILLFELSASASNSDESGQTPYQVLIKLQQRIGKPETAKILDMLNCARIENSSPSDVRFIPLVPQKSVTYIKNTESPNYGFAADISLFSDKLVQQKILENQELSSSVVVIRRMREIIENFIEIGDNEKFKRFIEIDGIVECLETIKFNSDGSMDNLKMHIKHKIVQESVKNYNSEPIISKKKKSTDNKIIPIISSSNEEYIKSLEDMILIFNNATAKLLRSNKSMAVS